MTSPVHLILGATGGIGSTLARQLVGAGARVVLAARNEAAEPLKELLVANARTLVDDIAAKVGSPDPPRLLRELLLIDGVILLTSGDPSLTVTDGLRTDVSAGIERAESEEA